MTISKKQHFSRNKLNQLPTGQLIKQPNDGDGGDGVTRYIDKSNNVWFASPDYYASYHQPMHLYVAGIRSLIAKYCFGFLRVPNLKIMTVHKDLTLSEIIVNRYTGTLITDPKIFGTFNFCKTSYYEQDIVAQGHFPATGSHKVLDIDPHNNWGSDYTDVSTTMAVPYTGKNIVVLTDTDSIIYTHIINILGCVALVTTIVTIVTMVIGVRKLIQKTKKNSIK